MNTTTQVRTTTSAAPAPRRPSLDLAITLLPRACGDLQLGWDPERAVLVRPPAGVAAHSLAVLLHQADGSKTCAELATAAERIGISRGDLGALLDELAEQGLLRWTGPAQASSTVHVHGQGPLTDAICHGLALGGIRASQSAGARAPRRDWPTLLVLADELITDPCLVTELVSARVSHLSVRIRDGVGMVGPLVLPGRTSCLRCAHLHRADRDPEWPMVAAQLLGRVGHGSAAAVRTTAGIALGQIEHLLDGRAGALAPPPTLNATIEVDPLRAELQRRVWSPHPRCGCGALR